MLAWVFGRCDDEAGARETPIGLVPASDALDTSGLDLRDEAHREAARRRPEEWSGQLPQLHEHFAQFGDKLPEELERQLNALEERLT